MADEMASGHGSEALAARQVAALPSGEALGALRKQGREAIARGEPALCVLAGGMATRMGVVVEALVELAPGVTFLDARLAEQALSLAEQVLSLAEQALISKEGSSRAEMPPHERGRCFSGVKDLNELERRRLGLGAVARPHALQAEA